MTEDVDISVVWILPMDARKSIQQWCLKQEIVTSNKGIVQEYENV